MSGKSSQEADGAATPEGLNGGSEIAPAQQPGAGGPAGLPQATKDSAPEEAVCNRLQVIIATCIGLFCLLSLLLMRNVARWNADIADSSTVAATVAQFRDFVSGCVGFLIGCPTHRSNQS